MLHILSLFLVVMVAVPVVIAHPCQRRCRSTTSSYSNYYSYPRVRKMICEYDVTVEWYLTMSKACRNCPFVEADCYRPDCIAGDGNRRPVISVNRQLPGPLVEVCEGDTIRFKVNNLLTNSESTTLHFHGIHQRGTPHMDGVPFVTQCPIGNKATWLYEFRADPYGTHLYHSHSGLQMADGLLGPVVIHAKEYKDPHLKLYDTDCNTPSGYCEHNILAIDWHMETYVTSWANLMHDELRYERVSSLVNGRMRRFKVRNSNGAVAYTPYEVFKVTPGKRYRFRTVKEGHMTCPFKFSVDDHRITIISADGSDVKPLEVDSYIAYSGERYDFILTADQTIGNGNNGNFWVKMHAVQNCRDLAQRADAYAILQYEDPSVRAEMPQGNPEEDRVGHLLQPIIGSTHPPEGPGMTQTTNADQLQFFRNDDETKVAQERVSKTVYLLLDLVFNDNSRFQRRSAGYGLNTLPEINRAETPVINNITFQFPSFNVLSQIQSIPPSQINTCTGDTINQALCADNLCECVHLETFRLGDTVEFIMINHDDLPHPFHMHGYAFKVLGQARLPQSLINVDTGTARRVIKQMNEADPNNLSRNLLNPSRRDTFVIHDKSYAIFRMKIDNPGYWVYHCHTTEHIEASQIMVLQMGARSQIPRIREIEANMPKCGDFAWPK